MSIVATTTRRSLRSSFSLKRHVSSTTNPPDLSLPPKKLRALISIYHEAEYFITPQNLDTAIDRAFLGQTMSSLPGVTPSAETSFLKIKKNLNKRRVSVAMGTWGANEVQHKMGDHLVRDWSDTKSQREKEVIAALYGGYDEAGRPGLEMLQEESERLEKNIADDKASLQRR